MLEGSKCFSTSSSMHLCRARHDSRLVIVQSTAIKKTGKDARKYDYSRHNARRRLKGVKVYFTAQSPMERISLGMYTSGEDAPTNVHGLSLSVVFALFERDAVCAFLVSSLNIFPSA